MTDFLKWWLVFILLVIVTGVLFYTGFIWIVIASDVTYISVAILFITLLASMSIGKDVYQHLYQNKELDFSNYRFIATQLTVWGLIGTIIGFIYMFNGIDFNNLSKGVDYMAQIATKISNGASTALYTTLFGAIGSFAILTQLQILKDIENEEE